MIYSHQNRLQQSVPDGTKTSRSLCTQHSNILSPAASPYEGATRHVLAHQKSDFKIGLALAGVAQWIEHQP